MSFLNLLRRTGLPIPPRYRLRANIDALRSEAPQRARIVIRRSSQETGKIFRRVYLQTTLDVVSKIYVPATGYLFRFIVREIQLYGHELKSLYLDGAVYPPFMHRPSSDPEWDYREEEYPEGHWSRLKESDVGTRKDYEFVKAEPKRILASRWNDELGELEEVEVEVGFDRIRDDGVWLASSRPEDLVLPENSNPIADPQNYEGWKEHGLQRTQNRIPTKGEDEKEDDDT